ncbi:2'-5' RNA ligase family protein [Alteromonas sp. C1M14]|uniref:2'-5' RNA ligase family protein n=1 Tax=Alteromonas sp. C1M14 TaxID=2841567 RepID=UPI001C0976A9|nr:2'-5' RNA ligase family protein [Alteromonas sp. C1M14]MBU2979343.1 2'-5' RNA ligase family protein [Alteromonas sp. C1M14]
MFYQRFTSKLNAALITAGLLSFSASSQAKSISMDVFAIPSQPIVSLVKQTSDSLKKEGIHTFYEQGFAVHATLYLTDFPEGAEDAIKTAVKKIVAQQQAFPIKAQGFTVTPSNWAFINLELSTKLQRLADEVTLAIEPLRDQQADVPGWVSHYPNKLEAFKRYGSPNVFQNFQPHLTLLANEPSPKLANFNVKMKATPPVAEGQIIGLGIGITDEFGQQKEVIARYFFN